MLGHRGRTIGSLMIVASCTLGLVSPARATTASNEIDVQAGALSTQSDSVVGAGWLSFDWNESGASGTTFTFTTMRPVRVSVTDVLCRGDAFILRDHGRQVLKSRAVAEDGCNGSGTDDPDVAYRDTAYSHGTTILRPGPHEITIEAYANPYGGGTGYIRFDFPPRPLH
jgi:hypothetical protein